MSIFNLGAEITQWRYLTPDGRGAPRQGDPAQSSVADLDGGLRAARRLHPELRAAGITGESDPPKRDMVVQPLVLKEGYLEVPDAPGLGIELNDKALARLTLR